MESEGLPSQTFFLCQAVCLPGQAVCQARLSARLSVSCTCWKVENAFLPCARLNFYQAVGRERSDDQMTSAALGSL